MPMQYQDFRHCIQSKEEAIVIIITIQKSSNKSQLLKIMEEYLRSVGSLRDTLP